MQTFRYEAADAQGRIETGTLEADSQRGANEILDEAERKIFEIAEARPKTGGP
ncbi:type II secretion system protein GspF, partial [Pseudomonas aeruginosa]